MNYATYIVSISNNTGLKFIEVTACDIPSAHADIREAYGDDVDIVGTRVA